MAAVGEADSTLVSKCMAFCQALAIQGQAFNFSLAIGPTFNFSLDTRGKVLKGPVAKKRTSPSTLRRNAKRREEFVNKKQQSPSARIPTENSAAALKKPKCDQCDFEAVSEKGLRQHMRMKHQKPSMDGAACGQTPEKLRNPSSQPSLLMSPIRDQGRVEICHNCGKDMSPTHLCEDSSQEEPVETVACDYCEEAFDSEDDFNDHLCAPFKCDQCEKAFYCEEELKNHSASEFHSTRVIMQCDK